MDHGRHPLAQISAHPLTIRNVKKHDQLLESKSSLKFRASVDSGVLGEQLRRSRMKLKNEEGMFDAEKQPILREVKREQSLRESRSSKFAEQIQREREVKRLKVVSPKNSKGMTREFEADDMK